ncbi:MAG TPA: IclR family transcriptional regulator [Actinomycetota bacterium]|nr:IclR family transcriptional regulator [Actinomycetota bacterium]
MPSTLPPPPGTYTAASVPRSRIRDTWTAPPNLGIQVADTGVGVLDRSVAILDAIAHGARTHADVVREVGLTRTTAHRLLKSLEDHGFIAYQGGVGYRLGPRLLELGTTAHQEFQLKAVARPALERLARATGESAQLYVGFMQGERMCIESVQSSSELRTIVPVGAVLPMVYGSAGKIFLAWMPRDEQERYAAQVEQKTETTPTPERLLAQLVTARRQGWASSAGERQPGVGSVSAPVLGPHGELVAVVSISGPTSRIGRISAKRYAPAVMEAAREIERALGG